MREKKGVERDMGSSSRIGTNTMPKQQNKRYFVDKLLLLVVVVTTATATPKTCIFYGYNIYCYDYIVLLKK